MKTLWGQTTNAYKTALDGIDSDIAKTYAKYLSTADPADYYNIMIKFDRLGKLQKSVRSQYIAASKKAGTTVVKSSELAFTNTFYREQYTVSWFSPLIDVPQAFSELDPRLVQLSVFGTEDVWKNIPKSLEKKYGDLKNYVPQAGSLTDRILKNRAAELAKLKETLTSGLIQGKSYKKITDDVKDVFNTSLNNASRIVRTEGTRNLNAGFLAELNDASSQGVEMQKQWLATLDLRTRSAHASADGQTVPVNANFHVNGSTGQAPGQLSSAGQNINCRCTTISVIPGLEPELRRGRNPITGKNEVFDYTDFNKWAKSNNLVRNKSGVLVPSGAKAVKPVLNTVPVGASIEEINEWAVANGVSKTANFNGIDSGVATKWANTLKREADSYPGINMNFIGSIQERHSLDLLSSRKNYLKQAEGKSFPDYMGRTKTQWVDEMVTMSNPKISNKTFGQAKLYGDQYGVSVNSYFGNNVDDYLFQSSEAKRAGWSVPGGDFGDTSASHEFGHLLTNDLNLRENKALINIFENEDLSGGLSDYGKTSVSEMVSEGWAEYRTSKSPRTIAKKIGDIVNAEYNKKYR